MHILCGGFDPEFMKYSQVHEMHIASPHRLLSNPHKRKF